MLIKCLLNFAIVCARSQMDEVNWLTELWRNTPPQSRNKDHKTTQVAE